MRATERHQTTKAVVASSSALRARKMELERRLEVLEGRILRLEDEGGLVADLTKAKERIRHLEAELVERDKESVSAAEREGESWKRTSEALWKSLRRYRKSKKEAKAKALDRVAEAFEEMRESTEESDGGSVTDSD